MTLVLVSILHTQELGVRSCSQGGLCILQVLVLLEGNPFNEDGCNKASYIWEPYQHRQAKGTY